MLGNITPSSAFPHCAFRQMREGAPTRNFRLIEKSSTATVDGKLQDGLRQLLSDASSNGGIQLTITYSAARMFIVLSRYGPWAQACSGL